VRITAQLNTRVAKGPTHQACRAALSAAASIRPPAVGVSFFGLIELVDVGGLVHHRAGEFAAKKGWAAGTGKARGTLLSFSCENWIDAMRADIFLVAMSVLTAAWLPTPANADCDAYNKRFLQFKQLQASAVHELDRVNALKPLPHTDTGLCRAALSLMTHANVLWMNPEPTCFENKAQIDQFVEKIHSLSKDAYDLALSFCSEAEMRRPTHD